jgi:hypothetical protein
VQKSRYFIDSLLAFLVLAPEQRSAWEEAHLDFDQNSDWQAAMFYSWTAIDPMEIQPLLRLYIDEWIDSGILPDGSEMPYERGFAPRARRQTEDFWDYAKTVPKEAPCAVRALADLHRASVNFFDGEYVLSAGAEARPTSAGLGRKGGITYFEGPTVFPPSGSGFAAQLFLEFFRSEWLYRIMRCSRCKALAVPDRKPRKRYERGWHCDKCRNSAAAQAATDARRARIREKWFSLAADAYREYVSKPRRSSHDVSAFLTEHVNKGLPYSSRIKRNWITRNLKEIIARAESKEERQNAKG